MQESLIHPLLARHFRNLMPGHTWRACALVFGLPMMWMAWQQPQLLRWFAPVALTAGLMAIGVYVAQGGGSALNELARGGALEEIRSTGMQMTQLRSCWRSYLLTVFARASLPLLLALAPATLLAAGGWALLSGLTLGFSFALAGVWVCERRALETTSTSPPVASAPNPHIKSWSLEPIILREHQRLARRLSGGTSRWWLWRLKGSLSLILATLGILFFSDRAEPAFWTVFLWTAAFLQGSMTTLDAVSSERRQGTFAALLQTGICWRQFKASWLELALFSRLRGHLVGLAVLPIAFLAYGATGVFLGILTAVMMPVWVHLGANVGLLHSTQQTQRTSRGLQVSLFCLKLAGVASAFWVLLKLPAADLVLPGSWRDYLTDFLIGIQPALPLFSALLALATGFLATRRLLDRALERTWKLGFEEATPGSRLNTLNPGAIFHGLVVTNLTLVGLTVLKVNARGNSELTSCLCLEFVLLLILFRLRPRILSALEGRYRLFAAGSLGWLGGYLAAEAVIRFAQLELGGAFGLGQLDALLLGPVQTLQLCLAGVVGALALLRLAPPPVSAASLPLVLLGFALATMAMLGFQLNTHLKLQQVEAELVDGTPPVEFPAIHSSDDLLSLVNLSRYQQALKDCWDYDLETLVATRRLRESLVWNFKHSCNSDLETHTLRLLGDEYFDETLYQRCARRQILTVGRRLQLGGSDERTHRFYPPFVRAQLLSDFLERRRRGLDLSDYYPLEDLALEFDLERRQRERALRSTRCWNCADFAPCVSDYHRSGR